MREPRFRIWDSYKKEMVYGGFQLWFDGHGELKDTPPIGAYPNIELLEYTGLKDKHGKEIFEGDIVAFTNHLNGRTLFRECRWHEAYPAFIFCPVGKPSHEDIGGWKFLHYLADTKGTMEIVGNIYETLEQLPKDEVQK